MASIDYPCQSDPNFGMVPVSETALDLLKGCSHIFWDFHGVLCSLRARPDEVYSDETEYAMRYVNEADHIFDHRTHSRTIQTLMEALPATTHHYCLSSVTSSYEADCERAFIDKHYPRIEKAIFTATGSLKAAIMGAIFCSSQFNDIYEAKSLALVDDSIPNLMTAEQSGFTAIHISSLIP